MTQLQHGFTLLETLISLTIFSIFLMFFLASFTQIFASQDTSWKRSQASLLAQENLEISYNIMTNTQNWTGLVNRLRGDELFHVSVDGQPVFISGAEVDDDFTRKIQFADVYRSSKTGEIASTSDQNTIYDPNTVFVKSSVEWMGKNSIEHIEYVTYITKGVQQ